MHEIYSAYTGGYTEWIMDLRRTGYRIRYVEYKIQDTSTRYRIWNTGYISQNAEYLIQSKGYIEHRVSGYRYRIYTGYTGYTQDICSIYRSYAGCREHISTE